MKNEDENDDDAAQEGKHCNSQSSNTTIAPTAATYTKNGAKHVTLSCSPESPVWYVDDGFIEDYGGVVWPCTDLLCAVLCEHQDAYVHGKVVVELGSGCGVVGIFAARYEPALVVMTDLPDTVSRVTAPTVALNHGINMHTVAYSWGEDIKEIVEVLRENLPEHASTVGPDVVVCSDVMYDWRLFGVLCESLEALAIVNPACVVLLAFEHRPAVHMDDVLGLLRLSFNVEVLRSGHTKQSTIDDLFVFRAILKESYARVASKDFLETTMWTCDTCTLVNLALAPRCELCASRRPSSPFSQFVK